MNDTGDADDFKRLSEDVQRAAEAAATRPVASSTLDAAALKRAQAVMDAGTSFCTKTIVDAGIDLGTAQHLVATMRRRSEIAERRAELAREDGRLAASLNAINAQLRAYIEKG